MILAQLYLLCTGIVHFVIAGWLYWKNLFPPAIKLDPCGLKRKKFASVNLLQTPNVFVDRFTVPVI